MRSLLLALLLLGAACSKAINLRQYPTSVALYQEGVKRFEAKRYNDAITAFERLTFDLPARDPLLALSHWYLGQARLKNVERLLAAQSFIRIVEQFPEDTLADDALFLSGKAYAALWPRPALDAQYGLLAQGQYRLLTALYPSSPFADSASAELRRLDEWFATKDFETGMHYVRRRAYDSAIIYLSDVVAKWPNTDRARDAMVQLVKVYRLPTMNYQADADEICAALRGGFPTDPEVIRLCKLPAADSTRVPAPR
jgi:outer membrane assembly lipoprotein YfiO